MFTRRTAFPLYLHMRTYIITIYVIRDVVRNRAGAPMKKYKADIKHQKDAIVGSVLCIRSQYWLMKMLKGWCWYVVPTVIEKYREKRVHSFGNFDQVFLLFEEVSI